MVNLDTMPPKAKGGGCRQRAARATATGEARVAAATGWVSTPESKLCIVLGSLFLLGTLSPQLVQQIAMAADTDVDQLDTYNKSRYI